MLLNTLVFLLGHWLIDDRHQSQKLDAFLVGIFFADFHPELVGYRELGTIMSSSVNCTCLNKNLFLSALRWSKSDLALTSPIGEIAVYYIFNAVLLAEDKSALRGLSLSTANNSKPAHRSAVDTPRSYVVKQRTGHLITTYRKSSLFDDRF